MATPTRTGHPGSAHRTQAIRRQAIGANVAFYVVYMKIRTTPSKASNTQTSTGPNVLLATQLAQVAGGRRRRRGDGGIGGGDAL